MSEPEMPDDAHWAHEMEDEPPAREPSEDMSELDALRFLRYAATFVSCGGARYFSEEEKAWFSEFVRTHGLPEICEVDDNKIVLDGEPRKPDLHITFTNMQSVAFEVSFGPTDLRP